jgi:tetratricopeptide (TPR) repeat protein
MAHARLKVAKSYIDQSLPGAYYEELHKALIGYISDKLTISVADLSKDNIVEALLMRGVSNKDAKAIIEIIDECEFARYAPDSSNEGMAKLYNDAVMSISNIENGIKRVKSSASKAVVTLLLIMLSMGVSAQQMSIKESWEAANSAYAENKFQVALDLYSSIEQRGIASADLYYNMGNTYYKLGDVAHTLLYYHKSLKLDPSHKDAAANLAMASGAMVDKIDSVPQFILAKWVDSVKYLLSSDAWAWITLALLAIVALLMFGFKFMHTLGLRRASFIVGCVFAVFALITYSFSLSERADAISMDYAVVMNPVSSVKSSPGDAGKSLFILHEGTKVTILDSVGSWNNIELADGRQGWIPSADITVI